MITLYQFPRVWGIPNASPFCLKLETWLRMTSLPYEIKSVHNPAKAPKGKLPYIKIEDKTYPDSDFIIDHLKKVHGDALDKHLTDEQRALAVFMNSSLSDGLYWVILYLRWKDEAGWACLKDSMFGNLPFFPRLFVPSMVRKWMIKDLHSQGMGRHSYDEVIVSGKKIIDALATVLGNKPYFMGAKPSSIDASVFGFLTNIICSPLNDPLKKHTLASASLKDYCLRIWEQYFPEMKIPAIISSS